MEILIGLGIAIYLLSVFIVYRNSQKTDRSFGWTIGSIFIPIILPIVYFLTHAKHREKQERAGIIVTSLSGINAFNENGTNRKEIIVQSGKGAPLQLQLEPNNAPHSDAVGVYTLENKQIGYLNKEDARKMAAFLDSGGTADAKILAIERDRDHDVKKCLVRLTKQKHMKRRSPSPR